MFPRLPSFALPSPALTEALVDFARPGGFLDAKDDLAAGPVELIVNPAPSVKRPTAGDFERARRLTTWHYQWIVVHQVLPAFVGQPLVDDILAKGRRYFRPQDGAFVPVEFQGTAYRFGHSMVRPSYRANLAGNPIGRLSTPLFHLPLGAIASGEPPTVLPQRTLMRHLTWSLPSGQDVARKMGVAPFGGGDLAELADYDLGLDTSTPLFHYVLKEAELLEDGVRLGPAGGRIVAEVFLGLLQLDPGSYLNARPRWRPTLPTRSGAVTGDFSMVDLLTFAEVDPTSRGQ